MSHHRLRVLASLTLLATHSACALLDTETKVTLASDPPGARVIVDGRDAGFVTPCVLGLDPRDELRIALELPGYEPAARVLVPESRYQAVLWREMYVRSEIWHFPMWLNMREFFVPVKSSRTLSPARIFVRLERTADK